MKGSAFGGIAVGAVVVAFLLLLPFVLVVALYTFFTIYGMTKGTTFDSASVNLGVLLAGVAVTMALLVCLLGFAVWGIDKALGPIRGGDRATEG